MPRYPLQTGRDLACSSQSRITLQGKRWAWIFISLPCVWLLARVTDDQYTTWVSNDSTYDDLHTSVTPRNQQAGETIDAVVHVDFINQAALAKEEQDATGPLHRRLAVTISRMQVGLGKNVLEMAVREVRHGADIDPLESSNTARRRLLDLLLECNVAGWSDNLKDDGEIKAGKDKLETCVRTGHVALGSSRDEDVQEDGFAGSHDEWRWRSCWHGGCKGWIRAEFQEKIMSDQVSSSSSS